MFQKSRPALSNRFQSRSSRTSACRSEIPWVTLRTPRSKAARNVASAPVRQHVQSGSGPCPECARTTCASLFAARSTRKFIQSAVKKGMSQLTITFHTRAGSFSCASSKAVTIPPSGPSPGQRSHRTSAPNSAYFPGAATTFTLSPISRSNAIIRASMGFPANSTRALSRPNRVLPPPAKTYAPMLCSLLPKVMRGIPACSLLCVLFVLCNLCVNFYSSSMGSRPGRRIRNSRNFSCKLCRCNPIVAAVRETFHR